MMAMMLVASATTFAGDSDALKAILKAKTYAEAEQLVKSSLGQLANDAEKAKAYNKLVDLAMAAFNEQSTIQTENQIAKQMGKEEIEALKGSDTMPTVLPGCAFFLNLPLSPVRDMINAGLPVAMASDFNPGTSPSGNMQFVLSCACIRYRMTPEEALNATTLNTAYAMDVSRELGCITKGKIANVMITKPMTQLEFMPYYYGANKVQTMILKGKVIK